MSSNLNTLICFKCGEPYPLDSRIGRKDTCPKCDADLHCCLNCRHYNRSAHNECNEPQAEWVRDKNRANFCDFFEPARGGGSTGRVGGRAGDARAGFEDLFRKKE